MEAQPSKLEEKTKQFFLFFLQNETMNVRLQVAISQAMDSKELGEFGEMVNYRYSINFSLPILDMLFVGIDGSCLS